MGAGRFVLAAYAVFMLAGGVIGFKAAGSKASLISGVGSAALLLVAFILVGSNPVAGFWLGAITSLLLCIAFALRLAKSGKMMPSGALLFVSLVALILLTRWALGAQGKL